MLDRKLLACLGTFAAMNLIANESNMMTGAELATFPNPAPDARIHYGDGRLQFGELRLPPGNGPHPVAVFIHGGSWLVEYDITHTNKLTDALARNGIATWSLEYRRVGNEGGGWPGTFEDIARGADHLKALAADWNLDRDRVIAMGHSAGGHLALWLAARPRLPEEAPGYAAEPLSLIGVLGLAPAPDLAGLYADERRTGTIDTLMGGSPTEVPQHYGWGSPMRLAPVDIPQRLMIGKYDAYWGPVGERYFETARARGDNVDRIEAAESGHFEMIDPDSGTWPLVLEAARKLLDIEPRNR